MLSDVEPLALDSVKRSLSAYGREYQQAIAHGPTGMAYAHAVHVPEAIDEQQPVEGGNGRFVLVFDGRIDNREELADILAMPLSALAGMPDSTLVMHCWERWQRSMCEHLLGDFAVIVWDRAECRLFAARDQFGLRPLSYHVNGERLVVASAPNAVIAAGGIARQLDAQKIADTLVQNYRDADRSFFDGIRRLPPAHYLLADRTTITVERYWTLDRVSRVRLNSDECYVEQGRELLARAVKARLRCSGRIGAEISGGLDSPSIAVTALDHLTRQRLLPVFTLVPEAGWDGRINPIYIGDEAPLVRDIVGMHPRLEPHFLPFDGHAIDHGLDDRFRSMATITRVPIATSLWDSMHRQASAAGVKVMLNGTLGNMSLTWSGRSAYLEWLRAGRLATLSREIRASAGSGPDAIRQLWRHAILPAAPAWLQQFYHGVRQARSRGSAPWSRFSLINPEFAGRMDVAARAAAMGWTFHAPITDFRAARADMLTTGSLGEMGDLYLGLEALHGVQNRLPLVDRRLVEWCFAIPEEQYLRNGESRWLIKRIMAGRLPEPVLRNRRDGFQVADWHRRMTRDLPRLREQFEVLASDVDVADIIDLPRIKMLLDNWPAQTPDRADPLFGQLQISLPHALTAGRFVRHLKGANL